MYGYHWEKIDVGHYWDLKGQEGFRKAGFECCYLVVFTAVVVGMLLFEGVVAQPAVDKGGLGTGGGYTIAPILIHRPTAKPSNQPM